MATPASASRMDATSCSRPHRFHTQFEYLLKALVQAFRGIALEPKCLDQARTGEFLGQPGGHASELGLRAARYRPQPPTNIAHRHDGDWAGSEHDKRHCPIEAQHHRDHCHDGERIPHEGNKRDLRRLLNKGQVIGEARHKVAGGFAPKPCEVGVDQMREGRLLHIRDHAGDDASRGDLVQVEEQSTASGDADDGGQNPRQGQAARLHQRIERRLNDQRIARRRRRQSGSEHQRQRDLAPARPNPISKKSAQEPALMRV